MSHTTSEPIYRVHAIRYAHDARRRLAENLLLPLTEPADLHDSPMPMDFFVQVVVGGGRTIVVDSIARVDRQPSALQDHVDLVAEATDRAR